MIIILKFCFAFLFQTIYLSFETPFLFVIVKEGLLSSFFITCEKMLSISTIIQGKCYHSGQLATVEEIGRMKFLLW